jgi:thiosulfate/3-mercaptopyruvate sulfurtransferase
MLKGMNFIKTFKYFVIFCCLISFLNTEASGIGSHLISVKEIAVKLLNDSNVVFIDIRKVDAFKYAHVKNAVNIWRSDYVDTSYAYGGMMPKRTQFAEFLSSLGVKTKDRIIVYDGRGGCEAARFWWILKCYGHTNAFVVDGGFDAFESYEFEITGRETKVTASNYKFPEKEDHSLYASLNDVKNAINDPGIILLDTRTFEEFTGEKQKKSAFRAGRIPSSIHNDWVNCIHYNDSKKLKSIEDLTYDFTQLGLSKDKKIIVYCQSGVRSAHTTFVLSELGYKNVRNYDGSWIEWSYYKDLPIDTGNVIDEVVAAADSSAIYMVLFFIMFLLLIAVLISLKLR